MLMALLPVSNHDSGPWGRLQDTATRGSSVARVALALTALLTLACRGPVSHDTYAPEWAQLEAALDASARPPLPGALRVRLGFGAGADLDLFVTDLGPRGNETVYFARHDSRTGGVFLHDGRCGDAGLRTDAVRFEAPLPEGIRIGVDYHASCTRTARPEPFVVEVSRGTRSQRRRGVAIPGHFEDRFWQIGTSGEALDGQYMPNVK